MWRPDLGTVSMPPGTILQGDSSRWTHQKKRGKVASQIFQVLNDFFSLVETTQPTLALLQVTGQRAREGTSGGACDSRAFSRERLEPSQDFERKFPWLRRRATQLGEVHRPFWKNNTRLIPIIAKVTKDSRIVQQ